MKYQKKKWLRVEITKCVECGSKKLDKEIFSGVDWLRCTKCGALMDTHHSK